MLALLLAPFLSAQESPVLTIQRAPGPIAVDGDLSDAGWKGIAPIDVWFETNPGDNVTPNVRNVGYLVYDDKAFYAGFEFDDPEPRAIRAPLGDRDNVPSFTDYGGVILDTRNDRKSAILFLANPRGIQYDAVSDDVNGNEDSSPDFFWEAKGKISERGWTLEIRIPFTSLRYGERDPKAWSVMLYRNRPREFRYQMFSTRLPRGGNCFICRSNSLVGLSGLPKGGHLVVAPDGNASDSKSAKDGLGTPLRGDGISAAAGVDVKWTPTADTALDATIKPDFSQIESDVAQIAVNERFALFFPEKRPFFLEGVELLSSPIQAVYTRTITSPRWGGRVTGKAGNTAYTALVAEDEGGGSVIIPASNSSDTASQDFRSTVGVGRVRRNLGKSFVSALGSVRSVNGGGHNLVGGPDFQWRPGDKDTITAQFLLSDSHTPNRPDLATEWDGRDLSGHAAQAWWSHSTAKFDLFTQGTDVDRDFRADNGFVPQVGYRQTYGETGWTFRPTGFFRRVRTFAIFDRSADQDGALLNRQLSLGFGADGRFNSFMRFRYTNDRVRAGTLVLPRQQFLYQLQFTPTRRIQQIALEGYLGEQIDFDGARTGHGGRVAVNTSIQPTDHLGLRTNSEWRWLTVSGGRLFDAKLQRLRATYNFSARSFLRLVGQWVETTRTPELYSHEVARRDGTLSTSALFAFKLNWQTVLFLGFGDDHELTSEEILKPSQRQFFVKLSYAFQH